MKFKYPQIGTVRVLRQFAFLPRKILTGDYFTLIWLEFYYEEQEYKQISGWVDRGYYHIDYIEHIADAWVTKRVYL